MSVANRRYTEVEVVISTVESITCPVTCDWACLHKLAGRSCFPFTFQVVYLVDSLRDTSLEYSAGSDHPIVFGYGSTFGNRRLLQFERFLESGLCTRLSYNPRDSGLLPEDLSTFGFVVLGSICGPLHLLSSTFWCLSSGPSTMPSRLGSPRMARAWIPR